MAEQIRQFNVLHSRSSGSGGSSRRRTGGSSNNNRIKDDDKKVTKVSNEVMQEVGMCRTSYGRVNKINNLLTEKKITESQANYLLKKFKL